MNGRPAVVLDRLLKPRSVVIVGASPTPGVLGSSVLRNLERAGFSGEVHLVNPRRTEINGRACVKDIADLPDGVDAAVLAIPRAGVLRALTMLAAKKVGAAVIFSAGFAEGGEEGLAEQREIARIARESGMAVEGPNCLGFVNNVDGVALTFVETPAADLGAEGVAIVSQSGAMAAVLSTTLASKDVGVTYSVSTGNEAATGVEDFVEYMIRDPSSRMIAMIVEQFRDPARFLALAASAIKAGKQILLLHPGRSEAARHSAATHTGAMAGDYGVMRTLVERAGVIVADTLEQLGDMTEIVMRAPAFGAGGAVVLTESGAFKALSLDLAENVGLHLPVMTDDDSPALRAALPEFVSVSNPVDLTAQALVDRDLYKRSISALSGDPRAGCVLLAIIQTDATTCGLKLPAIIQAIGETRPAVPIIYSGVDDGVDVPRDYLAGLRALGVPCISTAERAIRALAGLTSLAHRAGNGVPRRTVRARPPIDLPTGSGVVPEYKSKIILRSAGVTFPEGRLATTADEAVSVAEALGYPVVMKAQSAQLAHKSDAGGVILGLTSGAAVRSAWTRMASNIEAYSPGLALDGVLVERMDAKGVELILGAKRDPQWGPVMLVGFGGVQAEVMKDFRILAPNLAVEEIKLELLKLKGAALLTGFRGSQPVDLDAIAGAVAHMADLMATEPRISEIDLNPVVARPAGEGLVALDALILLEA
ncbi:MAG: CoA-binding domain-containing protein [Alphaproteobacteria bacterium]|nr:MAG: CoA-binding domain-containing protein [Caulobacteraceae bacterium]TPW08229.1 MAG: CoA-binding domain-containing protein [Alphaproteobacteria bacterium]